MDTEDLELEGFIGDIFGTGEGPAPVPDILMELIFKVWEILPSEIKDTILTVMDTDPAQLPLLLESFISEIWTVIPKEIKNILEKAFTMDPKDLLPLLEGFIGEIIGNIGPGVEPPFLPPEFGPPQIEPLLPQIPTLCSGLEGWFTEAGILKCTKISSGLFVFVLSCKCW